MHKIMMRACLGLSLVCGVAACSSDDSTNMPDKVIVVPSTATTSPSYRGDGSIPTRRYVVRMSDGRRDWEVEFPEVATGYELRIPLEANGKGDDVGVGADELTAADKQLLEALRRKNVDMEREGIYTNGKNEADPKGKNQLGNLEPGAELDSAGKETKDGKGVDPWAGKEDKPAPSRRSYFLGLEKVKQLYRAGKYELAIVFLKKLEQDYPNDVQIMSMMGTLWLKMGQEELAREYWEKVLAIEPQNRPVIEALKRLNARQGQGSGTDPAPTTLDPAPSPAGPAPGP